MTEKPVKNLQFKKMQIHTSVQPSKSWQLTVVNLPALIGLRHNLQLIFWLLWIYNIPIFAISCFIRKINSFVHRQPRLRAWSIRTWTDGTTNWSFPSRAWMKNSYRKLVYGLDYRANIIGISVRWRQKRRCNGIILVYPLSHFNTRL